MELVWHAISLPNIGLCKGCCEPKFESTKVFTQARSMTASARKFMEPPFRHGCSSDADLPNAASACLLVHQGVVVGMQPAAG
jgi:hypothetical protein